MTTTNETAKRLLNRLSRVNDPSALITQLNNEAFRAKKGLERTVYEDYVVVAVDEYYLMGWQAVAEEPTLADLKVDDCLSRIAAMGAQHVNIILYHPSNHDIAEPDLRVSSLGFQPTQRCKDDISAEDGRIYVRGTFDGRLATEADDDKAHAYGPDQYSEYPAFNRGPHMAIDLYGSATLSVKLPDGKAITFAFVRDGKGGHECCDVHLIHDGLKVECNPGDGNMRPIQKSIMFHGGSKQTRSEGTLATILINNQHLATSQSGYGVTKTQNDD